MTRNPISGPIPLDKFKELINLPFGGALKAIRKYDPLYGLQEGEKLRWEVTASGYMTGRSVVYASSKDEAEELAEELTAADFDWDTDDSIDIDTVELAKW